MGDTLVAHLHYSHADAILRKIADRPAARNRLRKLMAQIWDEGIRLGIVQTNPWRLIQSLKSEGDGYKPWTEADVVAFEERWPLGTKQRLAFALMLHTAQRRGDAIRLGPQHLKEGRLAFTQRKTGASVNIPVKRELAAAIDAAPSGHLSFLVTEFGKPFSDAGFGNWFRSACDEAGLIGRTAHGLRKTAAIRMAEAGATNAEIKAWTGHKTDSEVARYIKAANKARLADAAAAKMANLEAGLAKFDHN
ncbi:MAG: tyrosine-type recombinase/integrase [Sandaracinobacter sp.]